MTLPGGPRKPHIVLQRGVWWFASTSTTRPEFRHKAHTWCVNRNVVEGRYDKQPLRPSPQR